LAVIFFVILMNVSARKPESEELFPGALHKVPFDILLALFVFAAVVPVVALGESDWARSEVAAVFILFIYGVGILSAFLGLCMSAAARIKDRSLFRNTLIWRLCFILWEIIKWIGFALISIGKAILSLIRAIPLVLKTGLALFAVYLIRAISLGINPYDWPLETLFEAAVIIPLILYIALCMRTLQKGGRALASGDLSYRVDTKRMLWDLKEHGENLNRISDGTALAVEERLKSERMKTELITNVSHDIKTPLTSIINYAGLIGEEETDNEKIKEYSEVLVRQSERLKRLIEDLVEASKASTGNLDVQLMPCEASVFLSQAAGEYEEKMADAELKLITVYPEKELRIMADGRRMQRVFDNLMNNICKYAQPGTRVYVSLEEKDGNAVFTFRNTSKEQLNISEEELMERFTRGDSSRNTEGNGLGLSIAKSMAELQKGKLSLSIDGDLFKAILSFPLI
ncbi:MAG: sensor histidine kinase, partial [Firmicutes bacterium]|nr:sensor histidine kinase [Bacillota bacterium]